VSVSLWSMAVQVVCSELGRCEFLLLNLVWKSPSTVGRTCKIRILTLEICPTAGKYMLADRDENIPATAHKYINAFLFRGEKTL
jgi:hypothetical protein